MAPAATVCGATLTKGQGSDHIGRRAARWLVFTLPITGFVILVLVLVWGLARNPREVPSALLGKAVPVFDLAPVEGRTLGLASANLRDEVSLLNVFASWCTACREEHPLLLQLTKDGAVPVHGLNYKDEPADAARWLDTLGDPYQRTGADRNGRVAIDWGVYGVPETFVVSADGRIIYKHVGPLTRQALDQTILPIVARLRGGKPGERP
ncbi:DsbE family thiol:disulfide interchange protein [Thalassobaculum sp.]|uniref:DsbE family thiol:disulfide interchange protein n=1 Tax=Thalassobaculum sp. TaxID=2022740 RepID=UPI0032ED507A